MNCCRERSPHRAPPTCPPAGLRVDGRLYPRADDRGDDRRVLGREHRARPRAALRVARTAGLDRIRAAGQPECAVLAAGVHGLSEPDAHARGPGGVRELEREHGRRRHHREAPGRADVGQRLRRAGGIAGGRTAAARERRSRRCAAGGGPEPSPLAAAVWRSPRRPRQDGADQRRVVRRRGRAAGAVSAAASRPGCRDAARARPRSASPRAELGELPEVLRPIESRHGRQSGTVGADRDLPFAPAAVPRRVRAQGCRASRRAAGGARRRPSPVDAPSARRGRRGAGDRAREPRVARARSSQRTPGRAVDANRPRRVAAAAHAAARRGSLAAGGDRERPRVAAGGPGHRCGDAVGAGFDTTPGRGEPRRQGCVVR